MKFKSKLKEAIHNAGVQDEFVPLPDYMIEENVDKFIKQVNKENEYKVKVTDVHLSGHWGSQSVFAVPNDYKYTNFSSLKKNDICEELSMTDGFTDGKVKFQLVITEFAMFDKDGNGVSYNVLSDGMPMILKNCTYTKAGTPDSNSVQDVCTALFELTEV